MVSTTNLKILIIDDDAMSRTMLRFILSSEACNEVIGEAASGADGLALIEELQPRLVCLDVMLPDGNGLDVLCQIRQRWPQIVVLMVTGNGDSETLLAAVQGGASGYIVKPFNPVMLLGTVARTIVQPGWMVAAENSDNTS